MPTPNKYHPTGHEYTEAEFEARKDASQPRYLVAGYTQPDAGARWLEAPVRPFAPGRNKAKRHVRALGFKSLKNYQRTMG
jgi:hypothetical protein